MAYRKPTKKMTQKFQREMTTMFESMGAVKDHPRGTYTYLLETNLGDLHISVYDTWVAMKFDDVQKAVAFIGKFNMNPFSGKWNFHFTRENMEENDLAEHVRKQVQHYCFDLPEHGFSA